MRKSGQITSNFLTQESWGLYEIRRPSTCLCITSNLLTNTTIAETFQEGLFGDTFGKYLQSETHVRQDIGIDKTGANMVG